MYIQLSLGYPAAESPAGRHDGNDHRPLPLCSATVKKKISEVIYRYQDI